MDITKVVPGPGLATVEVTVSNKRHIVSVSYVVKVEVRGSKGRTILGKGHTKRAFLEAGGEKTERVKISYTQIGADRVAGLLGPTIVNTNITLESTFLGFVQDESTFDTWIHPRVRPKPPKIPPRTATEAEKKEFIKKLMKETGRKAPKHFIAYIMEGK